MFELFLRNDFCLELAERGTVLFLRVMFLTELSVAALGCGELEAESSLSRDWEFMDGKTDCWFFERLRE